MNNETSDRRSRLALLSASALLSALVVLVLTGSGSAGHATITIDANSVMRLGFLPLENTTVRDLTLRILGHLQSGKGSVVVAESASYTKVIQAMRVLHDAGVTNCALRFDPPNTIRSIDDLRRRARNTTSRDP